ncbi:MAG: efflux RND transporter periplasmic adaptor subunit, partial [Rhodopila sp.]|nr:efflux RND transporter periplasmic adaptor subunit [Rhodopila sp.]
IEIQSDAVNEERLVEVAFDATPADIHLAEQAEVVITTGTLPHAVAMPRSMISDLKDGHGTVWTVENGRIAQRTVTFGPVLLDGRLPLIAGLPDGASVVLTQEFGLRVGKVALPGAEHKP